MAEMAEGARRMEMRRRSWEEWGRQGLSWVRQRIWWRSASYERREDAFFHTRRAVV
ncbi:MULTISPECIES: hypothetical protein [unclassified Streptomyces]|uniref:hypothetical protein n=1 Tax=unclassified Streptomyces TaxID=2593676 RepID=UPI00135BFE3F|nr:hypothetical protein [Streptomyces sp. SLBN-31]